MRTKCSEGGDAAWAIEKILEHVLREKEVVYNHLSPIARCCPDPTSELFQIMTCNHNCVRLMLTLNQPFGGKKGGEGG